MLAFALLVVLGQQQNSAGLAGVKSFSGSSLGTAGVSPKLYTTNETLLWQVIEYHIECQVLPTPLLSLSPAHLDLGLACPSNGVCRLAAVMLSPQKIKYIHIYPLLSLFNSGM